MFKIYVILRWLSRRGMSFSAYSAEGECHSALTQQKGTVIPCWLSRRGLLFRIDSAEGECYSALTQQKGNVIPLWLSRRWMSFRIDSAEEECHSALTQQKGMSFRVDSAEGDCHSVLTQKKGNVIPRCLSVLLRSQFKYAKHIEWLLENLPKTPLWQRQRRMAFSKFCVNANWKQFILSIKHNLIMPLRRKTGLSSYKKNSKLPNACMGKNSSLGYIKKWRRKHWRVIWKNSIIAFILQKG